ncbi:NAD-dependent epimerase/dehydratase family protein [Cellulosimicrobium arenosum]|uniref:NAD(P)-dependent oxidoreductase n=1 Tax=Cellulosimicrobium arenosum TaxID=2708133 RepID=A0A927PFQ8_9MICO|nr:NAD(P)-dependent oxidoreductase [Cellulosimicrobium arenosum]MBD8080059.1 NAD(P)-dependent oxidoreductase [Cellulosimicrobium arenosum]
MTRVLVTGADGTIGRETVRHLVALGFAVTALSRSFEHPCVADRIVTGDARSPEDVGRGLEGADGVVHLAAIPHPRLGTPLEVYATNTTATYAVLSLAGERGVRRVVLASSINAFGVPMNPHDVGPAYYPLDEDVPADVADPYSLSKQADEAAARAAWRQWGTGVVALRFPLTQQHDRLREIAADVARDPAVMAREGWAYLDVRDAARAIEAALVAELDGAHVVGLAADDVLLAVPTTELLARFAPDVPLRWAVGPDDALVDTRRAREVLGFRPRHSVHACAAGGSVQELDDLS